jgi:phosphonopyruvate decarboxylase
MAVVYLQNSGLGNTVNPLLSIADSSVYGVPMLIIIGWRGEPGVRDEPQHMRQGELTLQLLNDLGVLTRSVTREDHDDWKEKVGFLVDSSRRERRAVALVVGKDTFHASQKPKNANSSSNQLPRESALEIVISKIPPADLTVATTGMLGRELYELRNPVRDDVHDFLNIGGMGHASSIALGLSLAQPRKRVWCLDGDGSAIMHLGSLAVIAGEKPANLKHIVFNNRAHDSVGGQPTAAEHFSFAPVATALGYELGLTATTKE